MLHNISEIRYFVTYQITFLMTCQPHNSTKTSITDNHLFQSIEETDHIDQNNGFNGVKKTTKQQQFCGDCGLFFHSKSGYKRHIEIVHAGNKPYKCSYCSLKFYEKRDLKLHFFRKHSAGNFVICLCVNLSNHLKVKGGLISKGFSLCLKSPKNCATSYPEH